MIMIGISTLSKNSLVYTHSSCFLPSPTRIFTRDFSTEECSLVQLCDDIDYIYKDLTDSQSFSISPHQLALIKQKILSDSYVLHPLQIRFVKKVLIMDFLRYKLPECPDLMMGQGPTPDRVTVVTPEKEDVLVLLGLSLMLFRRSQGCMPEDGYRLESQLPTFYDNLRQMGKADRLYKLDLKDSSRIIPKCFIKKMVKHLVGKGSIYKLIKSFLNLSIMDSEGIDRRGEIIDHCVPPVGEISKVLLNMALNAIFDAQFSKRFPGKAFHRMLHEVYISTKGNDDVILNDKTGYALLNELGLAGKIESIGPGDEPLVCFYEKLIRVDSDGVVRVCDSRDDN